jgi:tetratricopeptide (TPR) repeat protein
LSQRRLAFPGCSPAYISRLEAGQRIASPRILHDLARRLGVSEEYLATGSLAMPLTALDDAEVALRLDEIEEAAHLFQEALKDARSEGERRRALEGLGHVAFRSGDPELAIDLFERALAPGDTGVAQHPALAESLARAFAAVGRVARAIEILERCVEASEDDPVQYVRFAGLLGAALTDNGSFAEAERVLAAALARGRELADPYTRARLYWSESRLHGEQGRNDLAARYGRKALEILRATEDGYAIAHAIQNLANTYLDLGRAQEAFDLLLEGRDLIAASGTPLEIAQYRIEEARALTGIGDHDAAASIAIDVVGELQGADPVDAGRSYALLGQIFAELGELERAQEVLELAVELLERQAPNRYLVQAYKRLAELRKQRGETEGALDVLERALSVQERVGRPIA